MKYSIPYRRGGRNDVAPFVGAWIEISLCKPSYYIRFVAPFVGAWIEIDILLNAVGVCIVAPFVGAWIEIDMSEP